MDGTWLRWIVWMGAGAVAAFATYRGLRWLERRGKPDSVNSERGAQGSLPATALDPEAASQFYSGLVAELYDPLAGETARADDYIPFLEGCGTPALELCCGSGLPMLELLERGYDVEGLDASGDMLDLCRSRAQQRGLTATLHLAEMQSFELGKRYRSIFLAGASFTLLTNDADASAALERIQDHLEPGGRALIPLEIEDPTALEKLVGHHKETTEASGDRIRVGMTGFDVQDGGRNISQHLRYERIAVDGESTSVERTWERRSWTQEQFRELVLAAGFDELTFLDPSGGAARPDARVFVALARRG